MIEQYDNDLKSSGESSPVRLKDGNTIDSMQTEENIPEENYINSLQNRLKDIIGIDTQNNFNNVQIISDFDDDTI